MKYVVRNFAAVLICIALQALLTCLVLGKVKLCMIGAFCGLPCPGCGLTSAGLALLKGDWRASLHYHALLIPIAVTLFFGAFPSGFFPLADRINRMRWWHTTLVIVSLLYFAIRCTNFSVNGEYPICYEPANFCAKGIAFARYLFC